MPNVTLTSALRKEYEDLFNTCDILPKWVREIESTLSSLQANRTRYERVTGTAGVPWFVVAVIHNMEAGLNFTKHLHNGDPLAKPTVQVPAGRPSGPGPFTWEESAADALSMHNLNAATDWSLAGTLYQLERYNGWGYRLYHPEVYTPYLWSASNHYTSGKYVADGTWSHTAVSKQCGAAVLLRRMVEHGRIVFPDQPAQANPLVVSYSMRKSKDAAAAAKAEALQRWLNTFPGVFVKVDGIPGERTSDAFQKVTGTRLPGDPRP